MEVIKAENIEKIYRDNGIELVAVSDINLSINKGEFIVVAGPSGSGKTTLLNILGTLDKPTGGKITILGEDIKNKSKAHLAELRLTKMGFIFQAYNLIPVLTAAENIEFPLMLLGISPKERRERAISAMRDLGIDELRDKKPNQMSGGQQQRVAVARAIVNNPMIVLADEPTANLDTKAAESLLDLMQEMNEKFGITFIFSSHDNRVIVRAKRLIKLIDGKIVHDEVIS